MTSCLYRTGYKYQSAEKLKQLKEQNRERQKRFRDRNVTVTLPVTLHNATDKDKDKDKDLETIESSKRKRFSPPSLEQVQAYCKERENKVNPQRFIDFYQSKNWMVGKNKMKDWKASVRSWESRDEDKQKSKVNKSLDYPQREYAVS